MALKGMVVVEDTHLSWDSDFVGQTNNMTNLLVKVEDAHTGQTWTGVVDGHQFLDAVATGSGALVIDGDPGIGKSTLWNATVEYARQRGLRRHAADVGEI